MESRSGEDQQEKVELEDVKHKLLVLSGKGGVGKSTVAANLAVSLGLDSNSSVGILDADLHGPNIPKILGVEDQFLSQSDGEITPVSLGDLRITSIQFTLPDKDSPVVWRGPLKMKAIRQFLEDVNWGGLDYLIVDLPPGTGDEALSVAQLVEDIDGAIIVTTPQELSLIDVRKTVNFASKLDLPVTGIVENMSGFICPHCGEKTNLFKSGGGEKAAQQMEVPYLGSIPLDQNIVRSGDEGDLFVKNHKDSPAAKAFWSLSEQVKHRLGS